MRTFNNLILLTGFLVLVSCANTEKKESPLPAEGLSYTLLKKLSWLPGNWHGTMPDGSFGESWKQVSDSVYEGKGFFVAGKDTVSLESLRLLQEGNALFYEPTVNNQNNGKAVRFEMTTLTESSVVFENAAHDFPKKISYTLVTEDSLVAEISGPFKGKHRSELFPMTRHK